MTRFPDLTAWSTCRTGKDGCCGAVCGLFMAAQDAFKVTNFGVGGHGMYIPERQILFEVPNNQMQIAKHGSHRKNTLSSQTNFEIFSIKEG